MTETFKEVPNIDSRRMQPLPWKIEPIEEYKCVTLRSASRKSICSFWGGDTRYSENQEWCTSKQMVAHATYAEHALNWFPVIQAELERIYAMEEMPEEAIKAIEALMEKSYLNDMEMPPYAKQ